MWWTRSIPYRYTMYGYDFSAFTNVKISGIDLKKLSEEELSVLYTQARYCQAMTDADIDTMGRSCRRIWSSRI